MTSRTTTRESTNATPRAANSNLDVPTFIDEKYLCAELGISSVTATKWRAKAEGPPFIKVGRLVRYRRTDVELWLDSRTVGRRSA
ncbi:MAG: helix-turn-helix domain-containing protein [Deltaproteobacteria bacterium]